MSKVLSLDGMANRQVNVEGDFAHGFRVVVLFRPVMEDMFETVTHFALFASPRDAHKLADKVRKAPVLNLDHWTWHPSLACPIGTLQGKPWAQVETMARPASESAAWRD